MGNKDLGRASEPVWYIVSTYFFLRFPKVFILKDLLRGYLEESAQNPELQGVIGKIFQNKDLACASEVLGL